MLAYPLAYLLSLARLPFSIIPYVLKLILYYCLGNSFSEIWGKQLVQFFRTVGDLTNFLITSFLFYKACESMGFSIAKNLLILSMIAEAIRLLTEKGVMIFSALWQIIPHRFVAQRLSSKKHYGILKTYSKYYLLSDEDRLVTVLRRLKAKARMLKMSETSIKLHYVSSFQIVPNLVDLRAGKVRNVAQGIVYVHASWTNNPDILYGQALRRSPWIFDPRYLRRPFYYRTEANRLMTLFVFENAQLCPLFAIYQFGHEIKSARFDAFFRIVRWFGYDLEETVRSDGSYNFDPLAKAILKMKVNKSRALWTDDEVVADAARKPVFPALEIAEQYTYPLVYVKEVLLPRILIAQDQNVRL
jgi:hypothetical protein